MPKSLSDAYEHLDGQEDGGQYVDAIKAEFSKIRNEAKNLRTRAKNNESSLESANEKLSLVNEKIGYDPEDENDNFADKLSAYQAPVQKDENGEPVGIPKEFELKLTSLERQLKQSNDRAEKAENERKTESLNARKQKIQNDLMGVFKDSAVSATSASKLAMAEHVEILEDNTVVFKIGDEEFADSKEFGGKWLEANPDMKRNTQARGGDTNENQGGKQDGPSTSFEKMSVQDKMNLAFNKS